MNKFNLPGECDKMNLIWKMCGHGSCKSGFWSFYFHRIRGCLSCQSLHFNAAQKQLACSFSIGNRHSSGKDSFTVMLK